jgi:antirestriction protein ArdC
MKTERFDIHQHITDQIVSAIERGAGEFRLAWHRTGNIMWPVNIASKKAYRGVNVLALWATADEKGFSAGVWGSYRQWAEARAQIRSSPSFWPCRAMENRLKMHHQPTVLASPKSHRGFWG